jgi:regulator of replication initiation timing
MAKELEYFKDFLANPSSYKVKEFYEFIHEWIDYIKAHKDEFNYLEDEEWREIKERVLEALEEKEDMRYEFEELQERLDAVEGSQVDDEKIALYKEWQEFMRRNQDEYGFTDEHIADSQEHLDDLILSVLDCEAAHQRLIRHTRNYQKSLAKLDESLTEFYLRTGRRLVLTSLAFKFNKRLKGN